MLVRMDGSYLRFFSLFADLVHLFYWLAIPYWLLVCLFVPRFIVFAFYSFSLLNRFCVCLCHSRLQFSEGIFVLGGGYDDE